MEDQISLDEKELAHLKFGFAPETTVAEEDRQRMRELNEEVDSPWHSHTTVPGCRLSPNRADLPSLTLGLSVRAAYIDRARRRRFSSKIAGHPSIHWITGRVIVAMDVFYEQVTKAH